MTSRYDLVVLGAGSGGLAGAKRAASYGARVAIVEQDRFGGTCVIRGCVPKKLMVYAAEFAHAFEDARGYGWDIAAPSLDWPRLVRARNAAVASLEATHERLLSEAGVEMLRGHARVTGPHTVDVEGRTLESRYILVATGSRPWVPELEGAENTLTSDGFFELERRPDEVVLVGGGYIACEFAGILRSLGAAVHMVLRGELPLRGFDEDLRRELDGAMRAAGIIIHTRSRVTAIRRGGDRVSVHVEGSTGPGDLRADCCLLYATGRVANTDGLGLEDVGVELHANGAVVCGEDGVTAVGSILAVGDVTGRAPLTPVAIQAARAIADRIFGGKNTVMSYENIPTAVFTDPPIGTVGMTELEARSVHGEDGVRVYRARFRPLLHNLSGRASYTLVKLVVTAGEEKVLGCHVIGRDAPEIIQGFAVAVKMGATKADFDATVGIHPSTAEELVTLR
ncbi:MAG TPA: glutathione-disulfide reductase [Candidatus Limnocylindrales bacterium]|nr:glutathione-disulfide reductase [Candidatus Limnocylindrales bacterium]